MDKFFLAAVFGPIMIIFGLARLCTPERQKVIESLRQGPVLVWLISLLSLFFGLLILNTYNAWTMNLSVLVTLLGWVFTIRGVLLLFFYKHVVKIFVENEQLNMVIAIIGIIWGIALTYFAHF